MKRVVQVVPCVEGLQVVGVVRDEDGEVSAVLHQELLMLRLEVTAPLEVKGQQQVNVAKNGTVYTGVKVLHRCTPVNLYHISLGGRVQAYCSGRLWTSGI